MNLRQAIRRMLEQLLQDMQVMHQGAGYYSCTPFARRYNKLLAQARTVVGDENPLMATFEDIPEADPKDPSDKIKVLHNIHVEAGQLIALLGCVEEAVQS